MNTFEKFYDAGLKSKISEYYRRLARVLLLSSITCVAISVVIVMLFVPGLKGFLVALIVGLVIAVVTSIVQLAGARIKFSGWMLARILCFMAEDEDAKTVLRESTILDDATFKKIKLFKMENCRRYGSNFTRFLYKQNHPMTFFDFVLYNWKWSGQKWEKEYIFKGFVLSLAFQKDIKQDIQLIPKGIFGNGISVTGNKITIENEKLACNYTIYCRDEIEARKVLTLDFMEKIVRLNEVFPQKKYLSFRDDDMLTIFIEDFTVGSLRRRSLPLFKNQNAIERSVREIWNRAARIFKILDVLDVEKNRQNSMIGK